MKSRRWGWYVLGGLALSLALAGSGQAQIVQVLSTGDAGTDAAIQATLQGFGFAVTIGPQYTAFDGSTLTGYDAVVLAPSYNYSAGDMPAAGQTALKNFVRAGNGLITAEWTVWKEGARGELAILGDAIPVMPSTFFRGTGTATYAVATPDDTLNFGVSAIFSFAADTFLGAETNFVPKAGATIFYGSDYPGAGVIGWNFGLGRVISFSTIMGPMEIADPNYSTLVGNAVAWSTTPH